MNHSHNSFLNHLLGIRTGDEARPKKRRKGGEESSEVTDEEKTKRGRSEAARGFRSQRRKEEEREQVLKSDSNILSYSEFSVVCKGCRKKKTLRKDRMYLE